MATDQEGDRSVNQRRYTLEPLPRKVENFIKRRDQTTQERINAAFEYITYSPFHHENPTTIRQLQARKRDHYRYRIGNIRFIYRVDRDNQRIRIVQIDNRGDIY